MLIDPETLLRSSHLHLGLPSIVEVESQLHDIVLWAQPALWVATTWQQAHTRQIHLYSTVDLVQWVVRIANLTIALSAVSFRYLLTQSCKG